MSERRDPPAAAARERTRAGGAAWPARLRVPPIARAEGAVRLPGSKSISNRALLLAALARGTTELHGLLEADDTAVMQDALRRLGVAIEPAGAALRIHGCAGRFPARRATLFLGNAGTAMRPLAAVLAFAGGHYELDGVARMRERPIGDLLDALRAVGAQVRCLGAEGYPPLAIDPPAARPGAGARIPVRGAVSSQFLSGLLMAAPTLAAEGAVEIELEGSLVSEPYVALTEAMMAAFGVAVGRAGAVRRVPAAVYASPGRYAIEGDASGASYFLALGALAAGPVRIEGVGRGSIQGDVAFAAIVEQMGATLAWGEDWIEVRGPSPASPSGARLRAVRADCTAIPDAAMTAGVLALFADGPTRLDGIGSWRVKETDRIAAMANELRKLGAVVDEGPDWIGIVPPAGGLRPATIATYDDHRMAMCFALAAAGGVAVEIDDPGCVAKTYPGYFDDLARLAGVALEARP